MPFYSKDWRSPGEEWVKTEEGWEKKKILECESSPRSSWLSNDDDVNRFSDLLKSAAEDDLSGQNKENICGPGATTITPDITSSDDHSKEDDACSATGHTCTGLTRRSHRCSGDSATAGTFSPPPYCRITVKPSREVGGYTGFSEVFKRLDFKSALHDVRRFNYVCKLLELLVNSRLLSLAGTAQRVVLSLLEELAISVAASKSSTRLLSELLTRLRCIITEHQYFGHQLGSAPLWQKHQQTVDRVEQLRQELCEAASPSSPSSTACHLSAACTSSTPTQPAVAAHTELVSEYGLPSECLRQVLLCLADHRDLESSAQADASLAAIVEEPQVWRRLCRYHFTDHQLRSAIARLRPPQGVGQSASVSPPSDSAHQHAAVVQDSEPSDEDVHRLLTSMSTLKMVDWQAVYHRLRRMHGLREEYAECVMLCRSCHCLFWQRFGHPCVGDCHRQMSPDQLAALHLPIPPHTLLTFFSL